MRPVIKKNTAIFYPQGFLDGLNASVIIEPSDNGFVISKRPKAVFVSLKKIVFFNKKGLSILVDSLKLIQDKIHCAIGFCEYDDKKYKTILSMFDGDLEFSLFENLKVMSLFFDESSDSEKKILIYNNDADQKNQLAIELYEMGYKPYVAKDFVDFKEKEDEYIKYGIVVHYSYIANAEHRINVHIKNNIIFYVLNDFIDSGIIKKFDTVYHNNLLRVGFKVFVFDITNVSSMNIHGVNFLAKLSTAGAEYGTTFCMVGVDSKKLSQQLKNDLEDSGIILYKNMEEFLNDEEIKKESLSGGKVPAKSKKLTKNIIAHLNTFVDTTIHITQMLSQKNGKKKSVKIDILDPNKEREHFIVLFGVYKEINATFSMIFSKELLLRTCKIFIDDASKKEELYDALSEYANIVSSKIKSDFKLHKIDIETTLPRVFQDINQAMEFYDGRKGVCIELDFEGETLELFLSR
jgi:anti-anti-sigma regulatory factor/CheY-specific phosphatase CheX